MSIDAVDQANDLVELERAYLANKHQIDQARERRIAESHKPGPPLDAPQDCIECGDEIAIERLRRLPRTRRCEACGLDAERQYREARDA